MAERITGEIDRYLFFNEVKSYGVFKLRGGIVVVANFERLLAGDQFEFTGEWVEHKTYGRQFAAKEFRRIEVDNKPSLLKFLESGAVKGITKNLANKIVERFGEKTLDVLNNSPIKLVNIQGIGLKNYDKIKKSWELRKHDIEVLIYLAQFNIPVSVAARIAEYYGKETQKTVESNPYQLIFTIKGVGFITADKIARRLKLPMNHPDRLRAGVLYVFENLAQSAGHTYLPLEVLLKELKKELEVTPDDVLPIISELTESGILHKHGDLYFIKTLYDTERLVENELFGLLRTKTLFKGRITGERDYSDEQLLAIKKSCSEKLLVITGGPGTGKTTTLEEIVTLYKRMKRDILLCAPTGRAAKRMSEVIGVEAKTIHRMLEYDGEKNKFRYNSSNKLRADLIIIDELSMVNIELFYSLIQAIKPGTTVVFVGDKDQLPPIGPGNPLLDMIESGNIPVVTLNKIFRQAEHSRIIRNSHSINKGILPDLEHHEGTDFFFIERETKDIPDLITKLCTEVFPSKFGLDPRFDIQVLTPSYKGLAGVDNLNKMLQESLNSKGFVFGSALKKFRVSDKVMQTVNNYDKNVFNGDVGIVKRVDDDEEVAFIRFGDEVVEYEYDELEELTLAYATTVHKAQGSEYPCVIFPVASEHNFNLRRNLIYTAVTRAKKMMVIIGQKETLAEAIKKSDTDRRFTSLFKLDRLNPLP